jgi:hypothetical protein
LIEVGANVNAGDSQEATPLYLAASHIHGAAMVRFLVEEGKAWASRFNSRAGLPQHRAQELVDAGLMDNDEVVQFLKAETNKELPLVAASDLCLALLLVLGERHLDWTRGREAQLYWDLSMLMLAARVLRDDAYYGPLAVFCFFFFALFYLVG